MLTSERQYVSQYAQDVLGIAVYSAGMLIDPDDNVVTVTMYSEAESTTIFTRTAERVSVGAYQTQLTTPESSVPGDYRLRWEWTEDGNVDFYDTFIQIGVASPAYDNLSPDMKEIVDQTMERFADLFDAPDGGPNLQTYFESKFGRGRVARLLKIALGRLNTVSQPYQSFTIDGVGGAAFPVATWGALLERALYVEVIKHLRRSYVEQPEYQGSEVARLDRRDYLQRWGEILEDEEEDLRGQLSTYKISNMGLGKPVVLVSGGAYGRWAPTRFAGTAAARGRWWSRGGAFY